MKKEDVVEVSNDSIKITSTADYHVKREFDDEMPTFKVEESIGARKTKRRKRSYDP